MLSIGTLHAKIIRCAIDHVNVPRIPGDVVGQIPRVGVFGEVDLALHGGQVRQVAGHLSGNTVLSEKADGRGMVKFCVFIF